jgi:hypothetical protein
MLRPPLLGYAGMCLPDRTEKEIEAGGGRLMAGSRPALREHRGRAPRPAPPRPAPPGPAD